MKPWRNNRDIYSGYSRRGSRRSLCVIHMISNGKTLLSDAPIVDMLESKERLHGVSYGLAEAGYDIRLKQSIYYFPPNPYFAMQNMYRMDEDEFNRFMLGHIIIQDGTEKGISHTGRFVLASAIEEFDMPSYLVGVVHDKPTWARKGLSVFNTVIEPGWKGFLTLELDFKGNEAFHIPAGAGIAQVLFTKTEESREYNGKYQNQADRPVEAIYEKG